MSWVREKIDEIGMQRLLQDLFDEIESIPEKEPYLWLLEQDLDMTLSDYKSRNDI
jgi:hypothetical protein